MRLHVAYIALRIFFLRLYVRAWKFLWKRIIYPAWERGGRHVDWLIEKGFAKNEDFAVKVTLIEFDYDRWDGWGRHER